MKEGFNKDTDWREGVVLLIDKPFEWTSFNAVSKIRSLLYHRLGYKKIKVGHAGTLDPLATGLLIVCVGRATKRVQELQELKKEYVATFKLGATTPSFDLETEVDKTYPYEHVTLQKFEEALKKFIGMQMQVPPLFSAKSIDGGRAYKLARRGVDMELDAVPVEIEQLDIIDFKPPLATVKVVCSKGTYIRSLARDIGRALNTGAHLVELRRTAIGDMRIENALPLNIFEEKISAL